MVIKGRGICRNCGRAIILLIDRWIHSGTGNSACENGQTEAEPR